ncbi:phage tail assembly chaperone G, partial [Enterococcus faecalis]
LEPTADEYLEMQIQFVADLFDEKELTKEAILNGMDALDIDKIWEIISYRVLGLSKTDVEESKKEKAEEI